MKINLKVKEIKSHLAALAKTINCSTVLPILEDFLVVVEEGFITFYATDLETTASYTQQFESKEPVKFCINAKKFMHFVNNALADDISIEVLKNNQLKLTTDGFSVKLLADDPSNYPVIRTVDSGVVMGLNYNILSEHIRLALMHVSSDDLRPAITGIYFSSLNGSLNIAATDAHSLYFNEIIKHNSDYPNFIMPAKSARIFMQVFKGQDFKIKVDGSYIQIYSAKSKLIFRVVDAKYPDYTTVIPTHDLNFFVKRKQLSAMLKLSAEYVNKSTNQLRFFVSMDNIELSGEDSDFQYGFDYSIPNYNRSRDFEKFDFAFNQKLLRKIVDSSKDEYIKFHHSTKSTASVVIDDKFLLMPLYIHE